MTENQNAGSEQSPESSTPRRHSHGRSRRYRGRGIRTRRPRAQQESTAAEAAPPPTETPPKGAPLSEAPQETPSPAEAPETVAPISERIGETVTEIGPETQPSETDYESGESYDQPQEVERAEPDTSPEPPETESYTRDVEPEATSVPGAKEPEPELEETGSPIARAITKVQIITKELRDALDQMEEILELLEETERQQIGDEREIKALRKSLENIHRGGRSHSGGGPRHHTPHR